MSVKPQVGNEYRGFWTLVDQLLREKKGYTLGLPLGADQERVVTHSAELNELLRELAPELYPEPVRWPDDWELANSWFSRRQFRGFQGQVYVYRNRETEERGVLFKPALGPIQRLELLIKSDGCRKCYTLVDAEVTARARLDEELDEIQRRSYYLTDSFIERGPSSNIAYVLRKNRPTLAVRITEGEGETDQVKMLCALCLHPLGYYENSWAGTLPPSDEVMAHLLLIRSDEHYYWRKANQIPVWRPNSGFWDV